MNKKLLLWDADYIAYRHTAEDTIEEAIKKVDDHIQYILDFSDADAYALFISEGRYFRNDLTVSKKDNKSSYKANRGPSKQPWIKTIKEYLKSKYKAKSYYRGEADDAVVYWNNQTLLYWEDRNTIVSTSQDVRSEISPVNVETIIVATDKDVLYNTVGKHINPCKKTAKGWETVWVETKEDEATEHFWGQMIIGDPTDGIKGIEGRGKAFKEKIFEDTLLESWVNLAKTLRVTVLNAYFARYGEAQGIYEFQKNYRLLKMLETDNDWLREVGYIPELNNVNLIEKETVDEQLELNF